MEKISREEIVIYIFLFFSFLYPGIHHDSPITIFRLFFLVVVFFAFFSKNKKIIACNLYLILIFTTSLIAYVFYGGLLSKYVTFAMHFIFMYAVFLLILKLKKFHSHFYQKFYKFLDGFVCVASILWYIEYFTGFRFFQNLVYHEVPNIFYTNENEFATTLSIMTLLYLFDFFLKHKKVNIVKIVNSGIIIILIKARLSLISYVLFVTIYFICFTAKRIKMVRLNYIYYALLEISFFGLLLILFIYIFGDNFILGGDTLYELTFGMLQRFATLTPDLISPGSLEVRVSSLIIMVKELFNSYFWGIGIGNSQWAIANLFPMDTLKSMHNMLGQLFVECGVWFIIPFSFLVIKKIRDLFISKGKNYLYITQIIFIIVGPLVVAQSSGGIYSNYAPWAMVVFVFLLSDDCIQDFSTNNANNSFTYKIERK